MRLLGSVFAMLIASGCSRKLERDAEPLRVRNRSITHRHSHRDRAENAPTGEALLAVINKEPGQSLPRHWRPSDLINLDRHLLVPHRLRRHHRARLRKDAAAALSLMFKAAKEAGLRFVVRSAFRSYAEQEKLYQNKVREHGPRHAARFSARPGRSQHQLGTAIDVTTASIDYRIESDFADTKVGTWLAAHANDFGFALSYPEHKEERTGYAFEPWHFRFIGRRAAFELRESGLILEEYLAQCQSKTSELRCEQ